MQRSEIVKQINATLAENFELKMEQLTPEANLFTDLKLDSLDAIDMLVHLEEKIGKKLDVEKLKESRTLNDIYNIVEEVVK